MSLIAKIRVAPVLHALTAALIPLLMAGDSAAGARESAAQAAGAAGTAKGFVRVNGASVAVAHAVAVVAPDSFDPSKPVTLVLVTPAPLPRAAVDKAASRSDVFGLVAQGAIVEMRESAHDVVIVHKALGTDTLRTGGQSEFDTSNPARAKGTVQTFMPGDSELFGYKARYELSFDAPIVKRLPLAAPTTAVPLVPTTTATTKPAALPTTTPKTAAEARQWLEAASLPYGPTPSDALAFYLTLGNDLSAAAVRAYLVFGASPAKPGGLTKEFPLNALAINCDGKAAAGEVAEMLLAAGANPNQMEPDGRKASPAMAAVICPDVLKAILARKPNLDVVDANGLTAMHYALRFGKPRDVTAKMVMEAGFPLAKWRTSLLEQVDDDGEKLIRSFSGAAPGAKPAPASPTRGTPTRTTAVAIDWKAVGPYPSRSKAEAAKLLHKPGADNDPTEYMFDALRESEPQRLAVAIQAGADVRVTRAGSLMSPLHFLAWQCEADDDPAQQLSLVEQLLAAGADVKAIDTTKETPLISAADDCSIGMVKALIAAGSPLSAVSSTGSTALKAAILDGRADVVEALIDAGVDPRKEPYNANRLASGNKAVEAALKRRRR
jgi:ankyrin repeat protein